MRAKFAGVGVNVRFTTEPDRGGVKEGGPEEGFKQDKSVVLGQAGGVFKKGIKVGGESFNFRVNVLHVVIEEVIRVYDSEVLPLPNPRNTSVVEGRSGNMICELGVGVGGGAFVRKHDGKTFRSVDPQVPIGKPVFNVGEAALEFAGTADFRD